MKLNELFESIISNDRPSGSEKEYAMKIETEFLKQTSERFNEAFERIFKAISQLNTQQIWMRPSSESNSVGIILQLFLAHRLY
jgi:hypothetical protein